MKRVNDARCFAILADETTDISGIEQFSLCVRYIDGPTRCIREDFLQFVPVYDCCGKNLARVIVDSLNDYGVDVRYLRGQGYDGADACHEWTLQRSPDANCEGVSTCTQCALRCS